MSTTAAGELFKFGMYDVFNAHGNN